MRYESAKATKPPAIADGETIVVPDGAGAGAIYIPGMSGSMAAATAAMATKQMTNTVTGDPKAIVNDSQVLELPYLPSNKYWSYHTFPVTHTGATILTPEQPYLPSNKYWSYHAYPVSRTGATMLTQYHLLERPCLPSITYWSYHAYPITRILELRHTHPVTSTGTTILTQ
ncbi:hypothetical protein E3N88_02011 [Mikania micrantha]|uniref:Uncharacterized protein n=1 Tax=Mikania micrantha TaxID=192012 RepID=A0A5N6Q2M8_9ASTR|nr:hypothetical protein E3N88_02011 [Mikania micrantha]